MGGQWRRDISAALLRSCVGVLLLSPDFLASDFIYSEELLPLLEGAEAGSIILVVVPISASRLRPLPPAKYMGTNDPLDTRVKGCYNSTRDTTEKTPPRDLAPLSLPTRRPAWWTTAFRPAPTITISPE